MPMLMMYGNNGYGNNGYGNDDYDDYDDDNSNNIINNNNNIYSLVVSEILGNFCVSHATATAGPNCKCIFIVLFIIISLFFRNNMFCSSYLFQIIFSFH